MLLNVLSNDIYILSADAKVIIFLEISHNKRQKDVISYKKQTLSTYKKRSKPKFKALISFSIV